jgi:hypothetical protein
MSYGGRELAVEEALAAKATIDAAAVALRNSGVEGSLRDLRVLAYLDRLQGKNPLDRTRVTGPRPAQHQAGDEGRWDGHAGASPSPTTPTAPPSRTAAPAARPACRHDHRVKQAPGWKLEQIEPGLMRWTAPSGRTYTTTPTVYNA